MQGRHIYFLGIGGIGMSALALYYLQKGCRVSGYDRVRTPLTVKLEESGADIHYTEDPAKVPSDINEVVYTPAIPSDHKEWEVIRSRGLSVRKRAEVLGEICRSYRTVAVAGTHGKTTTSSLIAYLLDKEPGCNAILGGLSVNLGGNYLSNPHSDIMVTEADEYDRSFWQLYPALSVVTAWDADHLDIYGTVENMRAAYLKFMAQSKACWVASRVELEKDAGGDVRTPYGARAARPCPLNPQGSPSGERSEPSLLYYYGLDKDGKAGAYAENIRIENGGYVFDYIGPKAHIENLRLEIPGRHNIENAVAAISAALETGMGPVQIKNVLGGFKGVKRRLELCHKSETAEGRVLYYDDYAHHPKEISASLSALREIYPGYRLAVMFQPHLYTRTRDLAEDFARSLQEADEVCLVDIYPAREKPIPGVDTQLIGRRITKPVEYVSLDKAPAWAVATLEHGRSARIPQILVTMGAGNIDTIVSPLKEYLNRKAW